MRNTLPLLLLLAMVIFASGCKNGPLSAVDSGPRHQVQRGPVSYSIGEVDGLMYMIPDSVGWVAQYTVTDSITGPTLLLYKPGVTTGMNEPHIRLDYVSKKAHMSSSVKDIFDWLKGFYQSDGRASQVVNEEETITTLDGQDVRLLEIFKPEHLNTTGPEATKVAAKRVAYAYIDNGNGYWIGVSLSVTGDQDEYDWMMERFRRVIATYKSGNQK